MWSLFFALSLGLSLCTGYGIPNEKRARASQHARPNVVLILTDDQDLHLASMDFMPKVAKYMGEEGTFYQKHFCTTAVCCPSRVTLLTGKLAHNTNVTDVVPPYGGYPKFVEQGLNNDYLPVWLQKAGYNTYYTGKLFNAHTILNYNQPYPAGWNETAFLVDPGTYLFWNATFQQNKDPPKSFPDDYNTDLINQHALDLLDQASSSDSPFFLGVAPIAPHTRADIKPPLYIPYFYPPEPAPRHKDLFPGVKIPRSANFNPTFPVAASFMKSLPQFNSSEIDYYDQFYRLRLQSLQAVDEMVENIILRLDNLGILNNTYIIYTTDNGFHMGNHRLPPGKGCAYEEDVNIPFYVRGPGVPKGKVVDFVTTHTDVTPTIFSLAGIPLRSDFDGIPIPLLEADQRRAQNAPKHDHTVVEYWGHGLYEGLYGVRNLNASFVRPPNSTYKALRISTDRYSLLYTVWCTNEYELYDMKADLHQTRNLLAPGSPRNSSEAPFAAPLDQPLYKVQARLDAMLMVLKSCKAEQCSEPWKVLHPGGAVHNLAEAMASEFDAFYARQPKVAFESCESGYIVTQEGPQTPLYYSGGDYAQWT